MDQFNNCEGMEYVIEQGDTLYNISRRYGVPLALILRENPLVDIYNLQVGSVICLPVGNENQPVTPGEGPFPLPMPEVDVKPQPMPCHKCGMHHHGHMSNQGQMQGGMMMPNQGQMMMPNQGQMQGGMMMPDQGQMMMPNQGQMQGGMMMPDQGQMMMPNQGQMQGGMMMPNQGQMQDGMMMPICGQVISYVVGEMDTMQDIMNQFGIQMEDFLRYNPLDTVHLKPGTTIWVPAGRNSCNMNWK